MPGAVDFSWLQGHARVALMYSGRKDSDALLSLFRPYLDAITVYHIDTGDLLPEVAEHVSEVAASVPRFVRVRSDVRQWLKTVATPSDLVPVANTPIGHIMTGPARRVVTLAECCCANRWQPWAARAEADGITLTIFGQRKDEMHRQLSPDGSRAGQSEIWQPLADWSADDVWSYIQARRIPVASYYGRRDAGSKDSPECARCPASWGKGRAEYLRRYHPELARDYREDLLAHLADLAPALSDLRADLQALCENGGLSGSAGVDPSSRCWP